jgi:hypothetical protein
MYLLNRLLSAMETLSVLLWPVHCLSQPGVIYLAVQVLWLVTLPRLCPEVCALWYHIQDSSWHALNVMHKREMLLIQSRAYIRE